MAFKVEIPLIATANSTDATSETHAIAYDNPTTATGTSPNNTSPSGGQIAIIEGLLTASADGTVIARAGSESATANTIIVRSGSVVYYQQVA
jgi:uncharacterized Zn-binding protein involved in type VI secretion